MASLDSKLIPVGDHPAVDDIHLVLFQHHLPEKTRGRNRLQTEKLATTIKLGTHYAMAELPRRHQPDHQHRRLGRFRTSDLQQGRAPSSFPTAPKRWDRVNIKSEACHICHHLASAGG
jgi:hypothetical protein